MSLRAGEGARKDKQDGYSFKRGVLTEDTEIQRRKVKG